MLRKYLLILVLLLPSWLQGQTKAVTERRMALVVGNGAYSTQPLKNSENDARAVAKRLSELQFDVILKINVTQQDLDKAVEEFTDKLGPNVVGLFYYAGHGFQSEDKNYLLPVDFDRRGSDEVVVKSSSVRANDILEMMERSNPQFSLMILDACRNAPAFRRSSRSVPNGLARMAGKANGTGILFAAGEGQTAEDNPSEDNGLFTKYLLEAMSQPGMSLGDTFDYVSDSVARDTNQNQTPEYSRKGGGGIFYLNPGVKISDPVLPPSATPGLPRISSLTAEHTDVAPGVSVGLTVTANDPNADPLQYRWSANVGRIEGKGVNATFSPGPLAALEGKTTAIVTVVARNSRGLESSRDIQISIKAAPVAPVAEAITGRTMTIGSAVDVWFEARTAAQGESGTIQMDLEIVRGIWQVSRVLGAFPAGPFTVTHECGNCTVKAVTEIPAAANNYLRTRLRVEPTDPQQPMTIKLKTQAVVNPNKKK